ncbi:MAG TPA: hypothetical protein VGE34_03415 [Candidatus Saccharimonadales bacterium]
MQENPQQPTPQPQPPVSAADSVAFQRLLPTKNTPALLSYYFGVFGLIPFAGIFFAITAIVLGVLGLNKYSSNPTPGAKPHAIAGLALGIFEVTCFVSFFIWLVWWRSTNPS